MVLLVVVVCVWCVLVFVCECCGTLKKRRKPVFGFKKRLRVYIQNVPVYAGTRAHVLQHVRVVPVHTATFLNVDTRRC